MQFTQRSIQNFKKLYFQKFGKGLSDEETKRKASYLLDVYRTAYGMPSLEEFFDNKIDEKEK